ncbi:ChaN family lipoprotein [Spirosoma montaniterrae]|uniref:Iron-regulated protein n=1 Tax=Spirosoma montaniterrae TaxID=1178516 RepID=A0A1P9WZN3_9BACT|nr:ChaN family lipoprotein [Spirosoma montaniterrae]AQG80839.1 iron-regulated protein [Spirosoma montaniterrae]
MRPILLLLCLMTTSFRSHPEGPNKPAYQLYDGGLKATTYAKLLRQAADADVVLFGELHNNPICHWLQLQLTKDLAARKPGALVLGAEMFETDNQTPLTRYVQGQITAKELAAQARLWPNFDTDYKPIVDVAREQKIPFIATNVPRRYASLVARHGLAALDTLPADAKRQMAPLPLTVDLTLPGYRAMLDMMTGDANHGSPHGNNGDMAANFARAQAIKDATMAHFILQNLTPGQTLLHLNGDYHSKNREGISWYLRQQRPQLRILTISSVELNDVDKPTANQRNLADFVLAIPADMTKTY